MSFLMLSPDEIGKDLVCSFCQAIPLEPWSLVTCGHLVCHDCASSALMVGQDDKACCPVDQVVFTRDHVLPLDEGNNHLVCKLWSNIMVRCNQVHPNGGCNWIGLIGDYEIHWEEDLCHDPISQNISPVVVKTKVIAKKKQVSSSQISSLVSIVQDTLAKVDIGDQINYKPSLAEPNSLAKVDTTHLLNETRLTSTKMNFKDAVPLPSPASVTEVPTKSNHNNTKNDDMEYNRATKRTYYDVDFPGGEREQMDHKKSQSSRTKCFQRKMRTGHEREAPPSLLEMYRSIHGKVKETTGP